MNSDVAVAICGVSKYYEHPDQLTLRGLIAAKLSPGRRKPGAFALKDVSFEIRKGEALGLIGPNGAGKSTLLKAIGGITGLSRGKIRVRGSLASLIEVGAGFHPDLTGRENIHLNASLIGLSQARVAEVLADIIAFADIGAYLDVPVRTYSSGMVVRLGFAVAIHAQPDTLLIDEVLAVGDLAFQAKSFGRIRAERRRGTTIVLVSHAMAAISAVCDRAAWIEAGEVRMLGPVTEVVRAFQADQDRRALQPAAGGVAVAEGRRVVVTGVELLDAAGRTADELAMARPATIRLHYELSEPVVTPHFIVTVENSSGALFGANMMVDGRAPERLDRPGHVDLLLSDVPLAPGIYQIGVQVRADPSHNYFEYRVMRSFAVTGNLEERGFKGLYVHTVSRGMAPVLVPYEWITSPKDEPRG